MNSPIFCAECDACEAFAVSTYGADGWDKSGIEELARVHLQNCTADADAIDIQQKPSPDGDTDVVGEVQQR